MRAVHLIFLLAFLFAGSQSGPPGEDDNEFAEFEDADEEKKPLANEFDNDEEDYGINDEQETFEEPDSIAPKAQEPLRFSDVPAHFRSNWASYQVEAAVIVILVLYMLNYVYGRGVNQGLAYTWFSAHRDALEQQFSVVGDDGLTEEPSDGNITKETDYSFSIWCSGRVGVTSLQIQMRTVKRQDLVSRVMGIITPQKDRITFRFDLDAQEVDPWVLAVGQRKIVAKQHKELADLSTYALEKKPGSMQGLPASWGIFTELNEAAMGILDPGLLTLLRKYESKIHSIHASDQYCGAKLPDGETYTRLPEVSRVVIITVELQDGGDELRQEETEILNMIFYIVDKVRRFRLSREAKLKTEKNRQAVEEAFMKTTHIQRQEAAQARREERTRERKQRILEEEDPDKQRRLEKMEAKHDRKSKQPKMKQMKIR
ncbi:unnamed protein product, partial [Mesorhabditis spiculigera]